MKKQTHPDVRWWPESECIFMFGWNIISKSYLRGTLCREQSRNKHPANDQNNLQQQQNTCLLSYLNGFFILDKLYFWLPLHLPLTGNFLHFYNKKKRCLLYFLYQFYKWGHFSNALTAPETLQHRADGLSTYRKANSVVDCVIWLGAWIAQFTSKLSEAVSMWSGLGSRSVHLRCEHRWCAALDGDCDPRWASLSWAGGRARETLLKEQARTC